MKAMKIMKIFPWVLLLLLLATACEDDGDKIYLSGIEGEEFVASNNEVVLLREKASQIALSFAWTKSTLTVSNPGMSAPDVLSTYIQVSSVENFSENVIESEESGLSKAYTVAELNAVAKNLGLEPEVNTPVYFRLMARTGNNMDPVYSNIEVVNITSYLIDMTVGLILDANKVETGVTLASPEINGIYKGFMGATSWYNFYLLEGDGVVWGNTPTDGTEFMLSSGEDSWNCWFPGISGCYYVVMDVNEKLWSSLLVTNLNVSGDINAEMTFDRPNVRWTYVFNAGSASDVKIKLDASGKQYNYISKTDDAAATDASLRFSQEGGRIVLDSQSGEITVSVPEAGESTLIVDLSDPNNWICKIVSGSEEPEETPQYLYLPGVDDGISGSWTFDNYLRLFDEDNLGYAGVVNVNSLWGYTMNPEIDNWADKYTMAEGDAYSGTLVFGGEDNIPAPDAGLYLIDASTKGLTYALTSLGSEIYVVGLEDVWEFNVPLIATHVPGVYSGTITFSSASSWGFSIHLVNGDWNHKFGGSEGKLYYRGDNITDDASLTPGTYQINVDLINQTYSITQ